MNDKIPYFVPNNISNIRAITEDDLWGAIGYVKGWTSEQAEFLTGKTSHKEPAADEQ